MTEVLQVKCPGCQNVVRVPGDWLSQPLRCKHCRMIFQARANAAAAAPQAGAAGLLPPHHGRRPTFELLFALLAVVVLTVGYALLAQGGAPRPSGLLGLGLGVVGFLMMLCTETLYSLRKRVRGFHLGRMSSWLQWHVFTGVVGPYLVLLHSAGKFNGLAGVLTLLTVVMVASGFVGRYIYTAVPRTVDGAEATLRDLEEQIAEADRRLQALGRLPETAALASAAGAPAGGWMLVLGRHWLRWRQHQRLRHALQSLNGAGGEQAAQLRQLLAERFRLQMQIHSIAATRRLLALWHVIHVPLGVVLFTVAFVHIGAALYYGAFWK